MLLGHDELSPILSDPLRIQKILSLTHDEFFLGLGERHESDRCVNDAVDCLWTYLQQLLLPGLLSANRNKHVERYIQALNSIRSALSEGSVLDSVDVWYATLILILYEVRLPKYLLNTMLKKFLSPLNKTVMAGFYMLAVPFMFWNTSDHRVLLRNAIKIFWPHKAP